MLRTRAILKTYSNEAIAQISGYPVEQIRMLRKDEIDPYSITSDSMKRPVPVRAVMENIIEDKFDSHIKNRNKIF